jgi:ABC-2 type transport system permease protein
MDGGCEAVDPSPPTLPYVGTSILSTYAMRTIFYLVQKETLQVLRDRVMLFQIIMIPVVQLLLVTSAATFEVRQADVHLVDNDHSQASRRVSEAFAASERFSITERSSSAKSAGRSLQAGRADVTLHVPAGFERNLTRGEQPAVRLVVSGEKASAGVIQSYAQQILQDVAADLGAEQPPQVQAAGGGARWAQLDVVSRYWYNATLQYDDFMAPGILTILVTMIGTLLTAQNIAREKEIGTIEQLNVTPLTKGQFIVGKLLPFWALGLLEFAVGLGIAWLAFGIPFEGSLLLLFGVTAIYLTSALGIGLWISAAVDTQQQAMFVTYFVLVLYLFMSGLFTPVASMPAWAEWVAELSPLKHFIEVVRGVLMKGSGPMEVWQPTAILLGYGVLILTVAVRQYSKTKA